MNTTTTRRLLAGLAAFAAAATGLTGVAGAGAPAAASAVATTVTLTPVGGGHQPGSLQGYSIQVEPHEATVVYLSTDHGYWTDGTADPAPVAGAPVGTYRSIGWMRTDDAGHAAAFLAIGRDAGFDDDGAVTANPSATVGPSTDSSGNAFTWTSADPLNPGGVVLERAGADDQSVTVLPKAPTWETVSYDLRATDQFGNLVGGESIHLDGGFAGAADDATVASAFAGRPPTVMLTTTRAGTATPEASWTSRTTVFGPGPTYPVDTTGARTVTDQGESVQWYDVDFDRSTYTLADDADGTLPVGASVVETYTAVDQNGEPMSGVPVGFLRSGPDDHQDGDFHPAGVTDDRGQVSYAFAGSMAGTATVQAMILDGRPLGGPQVVFPSQVTDSVVFGNSEPGTGLRLYGSSRGGKDVIDVDATDLVAGVGATLWVRGQRVRATALDASGDTRFAVRDTNGNAPTKYTVKVEATDTTNAGVRSIRIK